MLRANVALACSVLAIAVAIDPTPAVACAPAPPDGAEVRIAEEEAIILWDPATRTEHFIRRAQFHSTARAFGFLVPTPTTPALGEVDAAAFTSIGARIQPEIHYRRDLELVPISLAFEACAVSMMGAAAPDKSAPMAAAPVRVLATAHVAGFDAITVEADDTGALAAWLAKHGFATPPPVRAWLERYVAQKWKLTAFVIATDQADAQDRYELATRAVRMTFQTDRPFYPYREPTPDPAAAPAGGSRMLRVHFLSTERHAATLAGAPWSAPVTFAGPLEPGIPELAGLGDHLRTATVFVDESYPRRGIDEVYFAPSPDRSEVRPPPLVIDRPRLIPIPLDVIALALLTLLLVRRRRARRAARPSPEPPSPPRPD